MSSAMPGEWMDVGTFEGTTIRTLVADAVIADVDVACACMFTYEAHQHALSGGLKHLNEALDGRLVELRNKGTFGTARFHVTIMENLPQTMSADRLMIINLGSPEGWQASMMEHAVRAAATAAMALGAETMAFAPSLLDSGFSQKENEGGPAAMLRGLVAALMARQTIEAADLGKGNTLKIFNFGASAANLQGASEAFQAALKSMRGAS